MSRPSHPIHIRVILPDSPQVTSAARIQLASFEPFTEFSDIIEPLPRASMDIRIERLAKRINKKIKKGYIGYIAEDVETGEDVGVGYWMRPGMQHQKVIKDEMNDEEKEMWEGMDCEKYNSLYQAFQAKMDEALKERKEDSCWYLEILAIHPSHQNKRIGPQLLDHHLSLISGPEARLTPGAAYLESSPPAKKLYASRGFEDIGDAKAEGWTGGFPAMIRPRQ